MTAIWYAIVSFMLMNFIVLEGFDIGAGMLQYIVGKTQDERRLVITAIGPLWSWHEVWLVGFGGTLLLSFPAVMAASFSGYYLALMLVLWCLILRGTALEVSGRIADPMWRSAWHFCFVVSNVLLAILVGAALGNVVRGVPVGADGKFSLAFFTNFSPYGDVGILDWYTVSMALLIVLTFAAHGANGLAQRTDGPVYDRSLKTAKLLWKVVAVFLVLLTFETWLIRPEFFSAIFHNFFGWLGAICVTGGVVTVFAGLRQQQTSRALRGSSVVLAGLVITGAAGIFPIMLRSTLAPEYSLSAYNTAAAGNGLKVALVWWPIAFVFAVGYFLFSYRYYSGKVKPIEDTQIPY